MHAVRALRDFVALESAGGILLALAAAAALALANSPLAFLYAAFLDTPVEVRVASFQIAKPSLLWINAGLIAAFFFLVGLEIKREVLEGELSDRRQIVLPAVAAVCGIAVPAMIYATINAGDPIALVAKLNRMLLHDTLSSAAQDAIVTAVNAVAVTDALAWAKTAFYLVVTSSQYQVAR